MWLNYIAVYLSAFVWFHSVSATAQGIISLLSSGQMQPESLSIVGCIVQSHTLSGIDRTKPNTVSSYVFAV